MGRRTSYLLCAIMCPVRSLDSAFLQTIKPSSEALRDMQVPKIGRRFVKPDDIAFIDITEYAPRSQTTSPYHMKIKSILPLLGDRVGFLFLSVSHACEPCYQSCKTLDLSYQHFSRTSTLHVSFQL